jgi:hypothetical protein
MFAMARTIVLLALAFVLLARPAAAFDFGLTPAGSSPIGVGCYDIKTADVNGDGKLDAVAAVADAHGVAVVLGNGTGLGSKTLYPGGTAQAVDLADFDGNGSIDIVEADWSESVVRLWTNQGAGTYAFLRTYPVSGSARDVVGGDFDGNGSWDVAVATGDGRVVFIPGVVSAAAGAAINLILGGATKGIAAGDLDNDGDLDLVAADALNNRLVRLRNDGAFPFVVVSSTPLTGSPSDVALADLDDDGFLDAAASLENGKVATVRGGALDFSRRSSRIRSETFPSPSRSPTSTARAARTSWSRTTARAPCRSCAISARSGSAPASSA